MPLTATVIRNAKPGPKIYRMADGNGLSLEVTPSGSRLWRLRFRRDGKEAMISLGSYPSIGG